MEAYSEPYKSFTVWNVSKYGVFSGPYFQTTYLDTFHTVLKMKPFARTVNGLAVNHFVVRCAISYHVDNLENVKNTHEGVLLLVKLHAEACNFTKSNSPSWVFFTFFKLYESCKIAQSTTFFAKNSSLMFNWVLNTLSVKKKSAKSD